MHSANLHSRSPRRWERVALVRVEMEVYRCDGDRAGARGSGGAEVGILESRTDQFTSSFLAWFRRL